MKMNTLIQFIKFGIVGAANTLLSLVIYYLVVAINVDYYLFANFISWVLCVANSFFWNNRYVFQSENNSIKDILKRIGKTYIVYGITFVLSTVLLYIEVNLLNFSELYAPIANLLITIPLNYLLNKKWTFSNK